MTRASPGQRLFVLVLFRVRTVLFILYLSVESNGARCYQAFSPLRWGQRRALATLSASVPIRSG